MADIVQLLIDGGGVSIGIAALIVMAGIRADTRHMAATIDDMKKWHSDHEQRLRHLERQKHV